MSPVVAFSVADLMLVPYVEGGRWVAGRLPLGGLDCWGIVCEVRDRAGLWTPDPWGCGPKPASESPEGLPEEFSRHVIELQEPVPFCGVQMRSPWPGGHAGVYLPDGSVLHLPRKHGVRREPFTRIVRRRRLLGVFDFSEAGA